MNDPHGVSRRSILRATALALPTAAATYGIASHAHGATDLIDGPVTYNPGSSAFIERQYNFSAQKTFMYYFSNATVQAPGRIGQAASTTGGTDPALSSSQEYAAINTGELRIRFLFSAAAGSMQQSLASYGDIAGWKKTQINPGTQAAYLEFQYMDYINAGRTITLRPASYLVPAVGPALPRAQQPGTLRMLVGRQKVGSTRFAIDYEGNFAIPPVGA